MDIITYKILKEGFGWDKDYSLGTLAPSDFCKIELLLYNQLKLGSKKNIKSAGKARVKKYFVKAS